MSTVVPTIFSTVFKTVVPQLSPGYGGAGWSLLWNGTDAYGELITPWSATGFGDRITGWVTPASIDADDDFLWCSTDGKWYLKVEATTGNFIFGYVDADGTTLRTVTGPALVALEKSTYTITLRPDGVVFNVAGTDYTNSNIPYALSNGIEFFASDGS
jgi:hypothetical protein